MSAHDHVGIHQSLRSYPGQLAANVGGFLRLLARSPRAGAPFLPLWPRGTLLIGALTAIAAIGLVMVLIDASSLTLQPYLPRWLVQGFNDITDYGRSGWFLWPTAVLLVLLALIASATAGRITTLALTAIAVRVAFVFCAVGVPGLVVAVVKRLIGRVRPLRIEGGSPFDFFPLGWRADYASLPSGHSTAAFAGAVALGALFPRARMIFWCYAAVIALSRVVVAAHYPSDVIAGAVVGSVGAFLVRNWFAARRLGFAYDRAGFVRVLPGPTWSRLKMVAHRLFGP